MVPSRRLPRLRRRRAGDAAMARFDLLAARWRRRIRGRLALTLAVLLAPCAVAAAIGPGWWDVVASFLAGAWVGAVMYVWDSPPEHVERLRRGAEGERRTAKELKRLARAEWSVAHDLDARSGNWDHIVVGRAGVFLLDSKTLLGEAGIADGVLVVRRYESPDELSRFDRLGPRLRGAAADVSRALGGPWVAPVVAVWPGLAAPVSEIDGVTYVDGAHLTEWLESRPAALSTIRRAELTARLETLAPARRDGAWERRAA